MSRPNRTTNIRARRRQAASFAVMDTYERNGKPTEELLMVGNGRARRHSPKIGRPPHWRAGKDDMMEWVEPENRE